MSSKTAAGDSMFNRRAWWGLTNKERSKIVASLIDRAYGSLRRAQEYLPGGYSNRSPLDNADKQKRAKRLLKTNLDRAMAHYAAARLLTENDYWPKFEADFQRVVGTQLEHDAALALRHSLRKPVEPSEE